MMPTMDDVGHSTLARVSPEAQTASALSETAIHALRQSKSTAGHSYSILDGKGRVRHVHPDGTIRVSRDPASKVVG